MVSFSGKNTPVAGLFTAKYRLKIIRFIEQADTQPQRHHATAA